MAKTNSFVVPSQFEHVDANLLSQFPFATNIDNRYQQVYASTGFPGRVLLTGIALRPNKDSTSAWTGVGGSMIVRLSTTLTGPDQLSPIFANNIGSDEAEVYAGSPAIDTDPSRNEFDYIIHFDTPFLYEPSQGHLLLHVQQIGIPIGSSSYEHDAVLALNDAVSRVVSLRWDANSGTPSTTGLVTKFLHEVHSPDIVGFHLNSVGEGIVIQWKSVSNETYLVCESQNPGTGFVGISQRLLPRPPINSFTNSSQLREKWFYRIEATSGP